MRCQVTLGISSFCKWMTWQEDMLRPYRAPGPDSRWENSSLEQLTRLMFAVRTSTAGVTLSTYWWRRSMNQSNKLLRPNWKRKIQSTMRWWPSSLVSLSAWWAWSSWSSLRWSPSDFMPQEADSWPGRGLTLTGDCPKAATVDTALPSVLMWRWVARKMQQLVKGIPAFDDVSYIIEVI